LSIITVFIAVLSEALSDSIQSAADDIGISAVFISAIVLPIVGNAAEHAGAVVFAMKGKVDLALGVAIGSSTQVALCVLPLLVIIGWMIGKDLDLDFGGFEASTLFVSVVSVTFAIKDGKSNWLVGAALMTAYLIIAIAFWAHTDEDLDS
jgi:Ca2+:H+ antiporter